MAWKYVGPHDAVEVPRYGVTVARGEVTDLIPDDAVLGGDFKRVKTATVKKEH